MQKRKGKKMTNTKTRSRRKFTAEFKAKVAMEALQEKLTLSELSKKYEVHPSLITKWKNQLKEQSTSVFKERGEGILGEHQASAEADGAGPVEDTVPGTPHDGR